MRRMVPALALLCAALIPVHAQETFLHHWLNAEVVVRDPAQASAALADWIETQGGWYLSLSHDLVTARLPNEALPRLRELLRSTSSEVRDMTPGAQDLRETWVAAQAALRSRQEILARNLEYLAQTDVTGTLAIEREVTVLMQEIEAYKGKLRKVDTDRRYARVEIRLAFFERALPANLPSSFPWIGAVDFYGFVQGVFR